MFFYIRQARKTEVDRHSSRGEILETRVPLRIFMAMEAIKTCARCLGLSCVRWGLHAVTESVSCFNTLTRREV